MGSLDSVQERDLLARGIVGRVTTDTPIAIRLRYKGEDATIDDGITSITTTTATDITIVYADAAVTTVVYDFATYSTIALLADALNATGNFDVKVLDTLRSYATASQFVAGAISAATERGVSYYDVKVDTDAALYLAYRITPNRGFTEGRHDDDYQCQVREIRYLANVSAATADSVVIYECKGSAYQTNIYSAASVDNVLTTITWLSGKGVISGSIGYDLVVIVKDGTSLANGGHLRVTGEIK